MKINKKSMIITVCGIAIITAGISLFIRNESQKASLILNSNEQKIANVYAGVYQVPVSRVVELKGEKGSWDAVNEQLVKDKYMISEEDKTRLHEEGYDLLDLYEADKLAYRTRSNAYDIIKERGKGETVKEWQEVERNLNLDTRSEAEKKGLSKAQIRELKSKKYSENDIMRIIFLIYNSHSSYSQVLKQLDQGKSIDELEKDIQNKMGVDGDE